MLLVAKVSPLCINAAREFAYGLFGTRKIHDFIGAVVGRCTAYALLCDTPASPSTATR